MTQLALANTQGSYQFNKVNNLWTWNGLNKGEELNLDRITSLLGQLASIGVATPLGKTDQDKYGMKSPLATIVLKTEQSITPTPAPTTQLRLSVNPTGTPPTAEPAQSISASYTLVIGQKQADGNYVMKSSELPYYVEVNSSIAEAFTNLVRSDLIKPPATESPQRRLRLCAHVGPDIGCHRYGCAPRNGCCDTGSVEGGEQAYLTLNPSPATGEGLLKLPTLYS